MKLENKRRAIYTILSEVISGDDLLAIMWHWQNKYSDKSQFELNHFLSDCKNYAEIADNRTALYRKLIALFVTENQNLKEDPWPLMLTYEKDKRPANELSPQDQGDWSDILGTVIDEIFSALRTDTQRSIGRYVIQHLTRLELPQSLAYSLHVWFTDKRAIDASEANIIQLKKLINLFYIATCEFIGPVEADKILSGAIRAANNTHTTSNLDARLFL
jgi:hypothetical protein